LPHHKENKVLDPERSLYQRLGGYDAIAAFADELLARLTADAQLGVYWKGTCKDSFRKERQLLVDFMSASTGGPVNYTGRDMKTSHEGLGISESDWDILVRHATNTMNDLGVGEREKAEVLAAVAALKGDIVETAQTSRAHA
jgi:hemoglobin